MTTKDGALPNVLGSTNYFVPVWERDWADAYFSCPAWKENIKKRSQQMNGLLQ
jgi:hypothetical protein